MTDYKQWDIVLVPFPFTNLQTTKKRPALIISPDEYNKLDVIIAFVTSKLDLEYRLGDYKIVNWNAANLPKPSMIRMKFATDQSIIVKKIGKLTESDQANFKVILIDFFNK